MYRITAVRAGKVVHLKRADVPAVFKTAMALRDRGWTVGVTRIEAASYTT